MVLRQNVSYGFPNTQFQGTELSVSKNKYRILSPVTNSERDGNKKVTGPERGDEDDKERIKSTIVMLDSDTLEC